MTLFWLFAGVMVFLAILMIVLPIYRYHHNEKLAQLASNAERREISIDLYKDRLAELERERAEDFITEEQFEQLKRELDLSLLEDDLNQTDEQTTRVSWPVVAVFVALVPVIAWITYQQTGAAADVAISNTLNELQTIAAESPEAEVAINRLIEQLDKRLQTRPDDFSYLLMSGRIAMEQGRYADAVSPYKKLVELAPDDAMAYAQYAQALYLTSDRKLTPEAQEAANTGLILDPMQPTLLGLLGMNSFEEGRYADAVGYWERLSALLDPNSPQTAMIQRVLAQAKERLGEQPQQPATAGASLVVDVSVGQGVRVKPSDSVFVFARALNGPPMPLAVARLTVADLPAKVELNDAMAMMPQMKLSQFDQVEVVARISSRGIANPGPGDVEGIITPVTVKGNDQVLLVEINTVLE